jgi:hypothetical protein
VIASAGPQVLRKGERQVVSPRLVDASCEVGDGLCRDILCLVRWVGIRHTVGPSGVRERPQTEMWMTGERSYPVGGHQVTTNAVCVVWEAPGCWRCHVCGKASRVPGHGERLYPGYDSTGARSNGGEDDVDGGENIGLAQKLLPVMWNPV